MWEHCMGVFVCLGAEYGLCVHIHTPPRAEHTHVWVCAHMWVCAWVCARVHGCVHMCVRTLDRVVCLSTWVYVLVLIAPRAKEV